MNRCGDPLEARTQLALVSPGPRPYITRRIVAGVEPKRRRHAVRDRLRLDLHLLTLGRWPASLNNREPIVEIGMHQRMGVLMDQRLRLLIRRQPVGQADLSVL